MGAGLSYHEYFGNSLSQGFWAEGTWGEPPPPPPGMNLGNWADGAWADGSWVADSWGGDGPTPEPPTPPAPPAQEQFSGGYFATTRRRSQEELERDRERFGIAAAEVIEAVAQRQAATPQADEQKRLEELERELTLRGIEWEGRYLAALNAKLEAVRRSDEQVILALVAMIA